LIPYLGYGKESKKGTEPQVRIPRGTRTRSEAESFDASEDASKDITFVAA